MVMKKTYCQRFKNRRVTYHLCVCVWGGGGGGGVQGVPGAILLGGVRPDPSKSAPE